MEKCKKQETTLLSKLINYGLDIKECIFLLNFINSPNFETYRKIINSISENMDTDTSLYILANPIDTGGFIKQDFYLESMESPSVVSLDDGNTWIDLSVYTKLHNFWYCLNYITCGTFSNFFVNKSFKKIEFPYRIENNGTE